MYARARFTVADRCRRRLPISVRPNMCHCANLAPTGGRRSSPAANAVLVIRRGAPQVMEADPGLEHESINTDCDEQDN